MSEHTALKRLLKRVWIVDEGSPGHLAQSKGLALALQEKLPGIELTVLSIDHHFSGFQRAIIRWFMGRDGRSAPAFVEEKILATFERGVKGDAPPDLIISSGGKSVFPACVLAKRYKAPYVFIGERKPYPSEWFHTVFTPSPREAERNDIAIDLIPTGVTSEKVVQAAASYDRPEGPLWAMIIGGRSRSHYYSDEDWRNIAKGMNTLSRSNHISWLLTTSRRTGARAEAILKQELEPSFLADAIWWATKPEKRMMAFLGLGERVFVTQDSVTMVTECVSSKRPVTVIYPSGVDFSSKSFIANYLLKLEKNQWLSRQSISKLAEVSISAGNIKYHEEATEYKMVEDLIKRLKCK